MYNLRKIISICLLVAGVGVSAQKVYDIHPVPQEQVKTEILGTLHKRYEGAFINKTRAEVKEEDNKQ